MTTRDIRRFATIADKVRNGVDLDLDDGVFLYRYPDLLAVGALPTSSASACTATTPSSTSTSTSTRPTCARRTASSARSPG
jgi:hypothetical protein